MPKFTIPCNWQMFGTFEVEASSYARAVEMVRDGEEPYESLPADEDYVDGSFEVDEQLGKEMNNLE